MARLASCPQDYATPMGSLSPEAVTLHRTYGYWPGDYAVIRNNSLCQFLIGKDNGNWVQFMDSTAVAYHCNGANFRAVGIELEGTNDDPLTDWQAARLGDVLRFLSAEHGIPLDYLDPNSVPAASVSVNHSGFRGVISHVSVATDDGSSQHSDEVSVADFQRALGTPAPTPPEEDDDMKGKLFRVDGQPNVWYVSGTTRVGVPDQAALYGLALNGMVDADENGPVIRVLAADHAGFLDMFPIAHA